MQVINRHRWVRVSGRAGRVLNGGQSWGLEAKLTGVEPSRVVNEILT